MELVKETRAKRAWIETKRVRKDGSIVPAKDHMVVSEGMFSTKEMEQEMIRVAKDVGASEDQIRVQSYAHGAAPIEANPRHRGLGQRDWLKRGKELPKSQPKKLYGGFGSGTMTRYQVD